MIYLDFLILTRWIWISTQKIISVWLNKIKWIFWDTNRWCILIEKLARCNSSSLVFWPILVISVIFQSGKLLSFIAIILPDHNSCLIWIYISHNMVKITQMSKCAIIMSPLNLTDLFQNLLKFLLFKLGIQTFGS